MTRIITLLLMCLAWHFSFSQKTVSGTITDSQTKETVPQVSVLVKGTTTGTVTDLDGKYSVTLPEGSNVLVFSYMGYDNKEVTVGEGANLTIDIALVPAEIGINTVVVSASRKEERIIDAPASVTVINAEKIATQTAITVIDHVQYTPGVDVMKTGLATSNVVIRGFNNIFSGAMLNIIDNRIGAVPSLRVNAYQLVPTSNADIERMEIVRGPGSALYGPNAADGVLAIFTKSPLDIEGKYETTVSVGAGLRAKGADGPEDNSRFKLVSGGDSYDNAYSYINSYGDTVNESEKSVLERGLIQAEFRHVSKLSKKVGFKISGGYAGGHDWRYYDSREPAIGDSIIFGNTEDGKVFEQDTTVDSETFDRDFKLKKGNADARFDVRFNDHIDLILSGGFTLASGIELTGLGAAQVDKWIYSYGQARFRWKQLYIQYFLNSSDAGGTTLIPQVSGEPPHEVKFLVDKSKLHVVQVQHSYKPLDKLSFIYGVDGLFTTPNTEGTINGRFEDDDNVYQVGGYLQGEWDIIKKLSLVGAARVDWHNDVDGAFISPRAALVYKPSTRHTLRGTYNRAFSSPSTLNLSLDISNGLIPFGEGINVRAIGNRDDGYQYHYENSDPANNAMFISPQDLQWYAYGDKSYNAVYFDSVLALLARNLAAQVSDPFIKGLVPNLVAGLVEGIRDTGTISNVEQTLVNYVTLAETKDFDKSNVDIKSFKDFPAIDNQITQTWELGYKGLLFDRLFVTADFYYTKISNFVSPLVVSTGSVMFDPASLKEALGPDTTGGLLYDNVQEVDALIAPLLDGNPDYGSGIPNGTTYDELLNIIFGATSQLPLGSVTPEDDKISSDIILNYKNLGTVAVGGMDLGATLKVTEDLNFSCAYSYVTKDKVKISDSEETAYLNAPKHKASASIEYSNKKLGLTPRVGYRFSAGYPANSAVYVGDVEPGHYLDLGICYALPFSKETLICLDVSNVTNNQHRPFPGTPRMGTFALFRISHTFKGGKFKS